MSKLFTNGTLNRGGSLSKEPGVNYKSDGTGRDTYILNNNGGLFTSYTKPLLGGISSHNALPNLRKSPSPFQSKNVNYRVDGSGRDFYIATDNGGQVNSSNQKGDFKTRFTDNLRTYEPNGDYLKNRNPPTSYEIQQKNKKLLSNYIQIQNEAGSPTGNVSGLSRNYGGRPHASTSPKMLTQDSSHFSQNLDMSHQNSFNVQKFNGDNRASSQNRQIAQYQTVLDSKLSQPRSPTRHNFLTVEPQQFELNKINMDHSVQYSTMSDGKQKNVKLRMISLQEREEIFKEYFERKKNSKNSKEAGGKSSIGLSNTLTIQSRSPTKQDESYGISVNGVYDKFDTNKDKKLSFDELRPFYNDLIIQKPELASGGYKNWFNQIDVNRNGSISQSELKAYLSAISYIEKRQHTKKPSNIPKAPTSTIINGSLNEVYSKFDLNKDSLLTAAELKPFYFELVQQRPDLRLSLNQFQQWFQSIDKNRNGVLEPAELNVYLISINYQAQKKYSNIVSSKKILPQYNSAVNAIFERYDINKDQTLGTDELQPFYAELVLQRPDLLLKHKTFNHWFNSIDTDKNGNMDPNELEAYLKLINYKMPKNNMFKTLDTNNDKNLSAAELRPFFYQLLEKRPDLKLSKGQFQQWFNIIDKNNDGVVEQTEFQAYLTSIRYNSYLPSQKPSFNTYKSTFDRFDVNKDGELSLAELRPLFDELVANRPDLQLGKIRYETWFNSIDLDKNGNMDPKELLVYLASIDYHEPPKGHHSHDIRGISHLFKNNVSTPQNNQSSLLTNSVVLASIFARFDKNRDKTLSAVELRPFFNELLIQRRDLGLNKLNYDGWFKGIDQDRDGKIDQSELQSYLDSINYDERSKTFSRTPTPNVLNMQLNGTSNLKLSPKKLITNPIVKSIYDRFDIDKNQQLDPEELRPFFNELAKQRPDLGLTSQKYQQWFNSIDYDKNGTMDHYELEEYLNQINYKMPAKVSKAAAKIYQRFDVNNDKNLSKAEIKPFYLELIAKRPDLRLTESGFDKWFNSIDSDNNGDMDHSELEAYLFSINYKNKDKTSKTVKKTFDQFDTNKDKNLTMTEIRPFYLELIAQRPDLRLSEKQFELWFNSIDKNKNGNIDPREFQSYLSQINYKPSKSSQKANSLFKKYDINSDNQLSMVELRPFFNDLIQKRPDLRLSEQQYVAWFNSLDKNKNGHVDESELQAYIASIQKSKSNQMFDKFDVNQDKQLSLAEMKPFFLELMASRPDLKLTQYQYQLWFNAIDKNRNGTLNPEELETYLKSINYKKPNKKQAVLNSNVLGIFARFDINKDHNLSPEELRPFFNELTAQRPDLLLQHNTYQHWFKSIDTDNDGNMDPHELQVYLTSINYKPQVVKTPLNVAQRPNHKSTINQSVEAIYNRFDINKDRALNQVELRPFYMELIEQRPDLNLSKYKYDAWFNAMDKDRSGDMDPYELETYLSKINYKPPAKKASKHTENVNAIFKQFDINGDKVFSPEEILPFYKDLIQQRPDLGLTLQKYQQWFSSIDTDHDGEMDPKELKAYLKSINYKQGNTKHADNVNSVFKRFDINGDKVLSPEEIRPFFNELCQQRPDIGLNKNNYQQWFNSIDSNKNGNMDPKELRAYLKSINYKQGTPPSKSKLTDQQVDNLIAKFDVNKDNLLTVDEVRPFYNDLVVERPDLGLTKSMCEAWFNKIDRNGDGKIDTEELQGYLAKIKYQG